MTDKDLVEIVCVLDRSSSMSGMKGEAISGFNEFLKEQKELPGRANMTVVLFNHKYNLLHAGVNVQDVPPLTEETYVPAGTTALHDAVGRTIDAVGGRLASTPEKARPRLVIFCVLTDGYENASGDYTKDKVQEMVKHQEEVYGWKFQYLAQGIDAWAGAESLGMAHVMQRHTADREGTTRAYAAASSFTAALRVDDDDEWDVE